jgi:Spy/CpxP family protein refolding chaperone
MKRMRWMSAAIAPALLVMAIGCGGKGAAAPGGSNDVAEATAPTDPSGETADESTADLAEHHRHHHHGGFAMFIAMSLTSIGETPEQHAQIEKIRADMFAKLEPAHAAEKNVLNTLADGIAAGNIDQGKIDAAIAQLATAAGGVHDAVGDSLNELHGVLNAQQRTALVDKVEAHLAVWHHTNSVDEPADKDAHGGHLGTIAKEYGLTPEQVETIRSNFNTSIAKAPKYDRAEAEAHMKAFGEAFASDNFDSKKMTTGAAVNGHMAAWGVTRMVHFYEAVTPALTPEQRTKVADAIRRHANYQRTETAGT